MCECYTQVSNKERVQKIGSCEGMIMKNIMFGNSLMLLAIFLFMWCGFMNSMFALAWVAIALISIGFVMAIVGYISKDKE